MNISEYISIQYVIIVIIVLFYNLHKLLLSEEYARRGGLRQV